MDGKGVKRHKGTRRTPWITSPSGFFCLDSDGKWRGGWGMNSGFRSLPPLLWIFVMGKRRRQKRRGMSSKLGSRNWKSVSRLIQLDLILIARITHPFPFWTQNPSSTFHNASGLKENLGTEILHFLKLNPETRTTVLINCFLTSV